MGRREKLRRVGIVPEYVSFTADGFRVPGDEGLTLALDELEAVRLIDLEGLDQRGAAERMGVARATVAAVYARARATIADALVNGRRLSIGGGSVCYVPETSSHVTWTEKERSMRVAVTYAEGMVFPHFGRTEQFKLYEVEEGRVLSSEVVGTGGAGHGALAAVLAENGVDALICGGLGGGALARLAEAGIPVYAGVSGPADEAVAAWLRGELRPVTEAACDHHGYGHGHGCGCGGEGHHHGAGHDHGCGCAH